MKTWADFHQHYLFDVHQCSVALAGRAVRDAAREFCDKTLILRATLDPVTTIASTSTCEFDHEGTVEVVKVFSATLDGQSLDLLLPDSLGSNERGMVVLSPREFVLQPAPSAGQRVIVTAALRPSPASTGLDDGLYADYARQIAQGAKANLYAMAEQPFSNPERATQCRAVFVDAINEARTRAAKGFSRAPLRTVPSFM